MNDIPHVFTREYFLDTANTEYSDVFEGVSAVWQAVARLQEGALADRITRAHCDGVALSTKTTPTPGHGVEVRMAAGVMMDEQTHISGQAGLVCIDRGAEVRAGTVITAGKNAVYIGKGVTVGPNAHLDATKGSICIGEGATLRQGAYVRELSLIGTGATIGNSCEIKCSLVGPGAEVPHFNYVGDSILGWKAHLGAGVKISNVKITQVPGSASTVTIRYEGQVFDTGLPKLGAIVGDRAQVGCNTVTNPGTLIGKAAIVYPGSVVNGLVPSNTVAKLRQASEQANLRS